MRRARLVELSRALQFTHWRTEPFTAEEFLRCIEAPLKHPTWLDNVYHIADRHARERKRAKKARRRR